MGKIVFRSGFDDDGDKVSQLTALECSEESMTQQQFKEECDINTIVQRFGLTGELPDGIRMPTYGDFSGVGDFQTAANLVVAAKEEFMRLPANIRERFYNDPQKLLEFVSDEKNRDEAIRLGIVEKPPEVDRGGAPVPAPAAGG